MTRMSSCVYSDYLTEPASPLSSADESFSDSETSSSVTDSQNNNPSLSYLSDFFTGPPHHSEPGSTDSEGGAPGGGAGGGRAGGHKSKASRKPCKYVPHKEKPVHVVEKRNARERRRVEAVNSAFVRLRRMVPHENRRKRISKVKTLRVAIDYINYLQDMIEDYDSSQLQEMTGLQQVPGGGMPHPAYIHQAPPGWTSNTANRNREEFLIQGPQYQHPNPNHQHHHQHQQQQHQPSSHLQHEVMGNGGHPYVHHHYHHTPPNPAIFHQESAEEHGYSGRVSSLPEFAAQTWPQSRVHIYSS